MAKNREKTSEDKFDFHKKKTERSKVLIMVCPVKPQGFSGDMTTE